MRIQDIINLRVAITLLCVGLVACTDPGNTLGKANQIADNFFKAVKSQDFEKAASYFEDTPHDPRGKWLAELRQNNSKLGNLESYRMVDKEVDTVYSGTRYIFVYKTKYAKYPARETLILFDGVSTFGGGKANSMAIQGMVVKSPGLQPD
ncbi:MAG: hypothetical protein P8164_13595 [Gammaproteobacteria bacterium]|jgi:hypothetical protein